jgi:hypothetical protein
VQLKPVALPPASLRLITRPSSAIAEAMNTSDTRATQSRTLPICLAPPSRHASVRAVAASIEHSENDVGLCVDHGQYDALRQHIIVLVAREIRQQVNCRIGMGGAVGEGRTAREARQDPVTDLPVVVVQPAKAPAKFL